MSLEKYSPIQTYQFQYNGKEASYELEEIEDGFWNIRCDLEEFRLILGSNELKKQECFSDVLVGIGKIKPDLMNAMWLPYKKSCDEAFERYKLLIRFSNK